VILVSRNSFERPDELVSWISLIAFWFPSNRTNFALPDSARMTLFGRTGVREETGPITSASPAGELQARNRVQY
jgi:hypothetical protein